MKKLKVNINSPVVLGFALLAGISLLLSTLSGGVTNQILFSVYRSPLTDPLGYLRLFTHVLGHADWNHFMGNMTLFLLLGPLQEEKYGSGTFALILLVTALATGVIHVIFFPNIRLLGASGVVFALILVSSVTGVENGKIPLTFILIASIYLGQEVYNALFVNDNISQFTHIIGGIVGAILAFSLGKGTKNTTYSSP